MERAFSEVEAEMSEAKMESLVRRLERVERENRRLKRGAVAVVGVIVAAILMGQGGSKIRIIEAEGFKLVDAAGVPRGGLFTFPDGSVGLALSDKDGKAKAMLHVGADKSTILRLTDKDGNARVGLAVEPEGKIAGLVFLTPSGKEQAAFRTNTNGATDLQLYDKGGGPRAALGLAPDGPVALGLFDKDGTIKAGSAVEADGTAGFNLYGKNQDIGVALKTSNGRASISVYPPGGKGPTELFAYADGLRGLQLWDKEDKKRAALALASNETVASLVLFDKNGQAFWAAH